MVKNNDKRFTKKFISETLGTRKYFSYRADLILYKVLLCIIFFLILYLRTSDVIFSSLMAAQVFVIFTLVNKMSINRKEKEGKMMIVNKKKREHFNKKINEMKLEEFEDFIKYFLEKAGYSDYKKIGKYMYSIIKENNLYCLKVFKLYEDADIEKIDIRSFITYMSQNNIKNGIIITANSLSEEAKKFMENLNTFEITIFETDILFEFSEESGFLPDDKYFHKKIYEEIPFSNNKEIIKNNTLNNKKIVTYILAACFFYITGQVLPYNTISVYICYYFILLAVINIAYFLYIMIKNININKGTSN